MPDRQIQLQHPGTCRSCGRRLEARARALWNTETKQVACISCAGPRSAARAAGAQPATQPGPAQITDDPWDELLRYHWACAQRVSVADPVPVGDASRWTVLPYDTESFVAGRDEGLRLAPSLRALFDAASPDESVFYGWPLVVVKDARQTARVAPLLIAELDRPSDGDAVVLARVDAPSLNPGLLRDEFFPADAIAAAYDVVAAGLASGEADAIAAQVRDVLAALGLPIAVDPSRLDRRASIHGVGTHNVAGAYRANSVAATRALLNELTAMRRCTDWRTTAARFLLESELPAAPVAGGPTIAPLPLTDGQEQALVATATLPVTVVTGPPGTGKSYLVAAVVAGAWMRGESVLVASTNNRAVDVAARKAAQIDPGLLIRTGSMEFREALPSILEDQADRPPQPAVSAAVAGRELDLAVAQRNAVLARLERHAELDGKLAQLALDLETQRCQLWNDPGRSPVHDGRAKLGRRARRVDAARWFAARRRARLLRAAQVVSDQVGPADIANWAESELTWDRLSAEATELGPRDSEADRAALAEADMRWVQASRAAVGRTVAESMSRGAAALRTLARIRRGAEPGRLASVVQALRFARGWACTALSVAPNFPLIAGLFDLVVIDEASQCGIAEILPLAYRAKRLVIVGDPNQLTPVVSLTGSSLAAVARSVGVDQQAMRDRGVSYDKDSAYTAFARRIDGPPFLLDEHYRCHPQIAAFFNRHFYAGTLRVLTDVTEHIGELGGLYRLLVAGETESDDHGGAFNRAEADAIVSWVLDHPDEPGTIGVVTPFAAQASLIERSLRRGLGSEQWDRRQVTVGTAHRFQGDDRDIVLFSLVLARGAKPGTARWVETQRNLVNVAVSRAKRALVVVGDADAIDELNVGTLSSLIAVAGDADADLAADPSSDDRRLHSQAEQRLYGALLAAGVPVELKPVVEGYELDFAVVAADGTRLDIECDGTQHRDERGRQRRQDLIRDHVLTKLGWQVHRYPAWRCFTDPHGVAAEIAVQAGHAPKIIAD